MKIGIFLHVVEDLIRANEIFSAEKTLLLALQEEPDFYIYHEKMGDISCIQKNFSKAEKNYNKALELNPKAGWVLKKINSVKTKLNSVAGIYDRYPDLTGKRNLEGGKRLSGRVLSSSVEFPLVTIITVVFNNEHSLQRCIDSVAAQTYKNIEYIIIDGGSDNPTIRVIQSNASRLDYYISEPDLGIYSAMNKGINLAKGDYICLLNSDDYYEPSFVERAISLIKESNEKVDILYTDYNVGVNQLIAQPISDGILFGHLHICHNTFLVARDCYDKIGPYNENYKIVSDAIWMREAFLQNSVFKHLPKTMFTLTEGGLSSGNTEARRVLFIEEVVKSYKLNFPEIEDNDAEAIYLFRFNRERTKELISLAKKYNRNIRIKSALKKYVEHCFKDRKNFHLKSDQSHTIFPQYIELLEILDGDKKCIQLETKTGMFCDLLKKIESIVKQKKPNSKYKILHFITVFSAPSETFVYDLLTRLESETEYDNFVIYEHEKLKNERPFEKSINIYWSDFPEPVAKQLYSHIAKHLKPDLIIAHFALNEWKWSKRIEGLDIDIPTISMCHGIDVFSMKTDAPYQEYILNNFSKRENTRFTAVSNYLRNEMISNGIPSNKIDLLHNTVSPIFLENHKNDDFYNKEKTLKLLSVGRLIGLKGHDHLLRALSIFCKKATANVQLTIVYGNGSELLDYLASMATELNIREKIIFEPFVDFKNTPSYFKKFDMFLHPSCYSKDSHKRSETFGISILEAIAAGLPVITTNAGGIPEVIGSENTFAKVVNHSDEIALANAMIEMWEKGNAFTSNINYAKERVDTFSEKKQITKFKKIIEGVIKPPIKIALFSTSTIQGAGYAAFRLHKGLRDTKILPHLFTTVRNHEAEEDITVLKHPSGDNRNWSALQLQPKPGLTISTLNQQHISSKELIKLVEPFDIINLHWYARFLSIENIAALTHLKKPVIMTIRDMLPISGGCHSFHGCKKWMENCSDCPQISSKYTYFPAETLAAKRTHYNFDNITIVTLSNHSREIVEKSPLFKDCRIEVINNSIETETFKPYDKLTTRRELNLPLDRKIIGYIPSFASEVKGYKEFIEAINLIVSKNLPDAPLVMLVGNDTPASAAINMDKKVLGYINDNHKLAQAYSAADVIVVPSHEETFSNTTAEAISCGTPVVGFKTGAIPELVINGKTGFVFEVGDASGLAKGIIDVLYGPDLSKNCRSLAESLLSFEIQAKKYEDLITDLMTNHKENKNYVVNDNIIEIFEEPGLTFPLIAAEKILSIK